MPLRLAALGLGIYLSLFDLFLLIASSMCAEKEVWFCSFGRCEPDDLTSDGMILN